MSSRRPNVEIRISAGGEAGQVPTVTCTVDDQTASVELADVSVLGVFVQQPDPLAVDSEVDIALRFSDATFAMHAHVVQCVPKDRAAAENRKPGFALLFEHIDEHERARLRKRVDAVLALRAASQRPAAVVTPQPSKPPGAATRAVGTSTPAPSVSAEERALLTKLQAELRTLAGKPPWEILGVSQGADLPTAKAAFFAASKRYHPHLFSRYQLPELKQTVTELFIAHKRACDSMSRTPTARQTQPIRVSVRPPSERARTPVPSVPPSPVPPRHSPLPTATPVDRRAARASSDLSAALGLERALRAPPEPKFHGPDAGRFVHDALRHLSQGRFDQAETDLEKALSLDPVSANARVWLLVTQARKARADGKLDECIAKYKEVLVLDPKNYEALTETKRVASAGGGGGGLLSRFFGGGNQEK